MRNLLFKLKSIFGLHNGGVISVKDTLWTKDHRPHPNAKAIEVPPFEKFKDVYKESDYDWPA